MSLFEGLQKLLKQMPRKDSHAVPAPMAGKPLAESREKSAPPAKEKSVAAPRNRQGIPLLTEDANNFFTKASQEAEIPAKTPDPPLLSPRIPAKTPPSSAQKKREKKQKSSGLPILDGNQDLLLAMQAPRSREENTARKLPSHIKRKPQAPKVSSRPLFKDKNGIPILKDQTDFLRVFNVATGESASSGTRLSPGNKAHPPLSQGREESPHEFSSGLLKTLSEKSQDVLLREKKAGSRSSFSFTIEERIRRYPAPQKTLDLHGFSGIQARLKTEIFLQQAQSEGIFTVRIIVGRGLHSQGPAVLPDIVDQKIREMEETGTVLTWKWEQQASREPLGSVQVFLKHF